MDAITAAAGLKMSDISRKRKRSAAAAAWSCCCCRRRRGTVVGGLTMNGLFLSTSAAKDGGRRRRRCALESGLTDGNFAVSLCLSSWMSCPRKGQDGGEAGVQKRGTGLERELIQRPNPK